jgi:hypothetical protein
MFNWFLHTAEQIQYLTNHESKDNQKEKKEIRLLQNSKPANVSSV